MYKVSVILPSFCGKYDGCATKRKDKLRRAINSFLKQSHLHKELVIVSDGCNDTDKIIQKEYLKKHEIKHIRIEKQPIFSGNVRQAGLESATGDVVCYLDSDDYITPSHLASLSNRMYERELDWAYYNDFLKIDENTIIVRNVEPYAGMAGTSAIAHLRSMKASWSGCDGYGHDWVFITKLRDESKRYEKIFGCGYVVCHTNNGFDN